MEACPFCNAEVDEELILYGGTCPNCLNEIPGEEAPTDPGEQALANAEVEAQITRSRSWTPLLAALLIGAVVLGGGGYYYSTTLTEPDTPQPLRQITINRDLSAHVNPDLPEDAKPDVEARPERKQTPNRVAAAAVTAPPTGGVVEEAAQPEQPAKSNIGPSRPSALGEFDIGAGPSIGVGSLPAAKVLSNPDEIDQMVAKSIGARRRQVQACYESRLKTVENLQGTWNVSFVVTPSGGTSRVSVSSREAQDATLESCLKRKVEAWRFQKITKEHPVTLPLRFSPT